MWECDNPNPNPNPTLRNPKGGNVNTLILTPTQQKNHKGGNVTTPTRILTLTLISPKGRDMKTLTLTLTLGIPPGRDPPPVCHPKLDCSFTANQIKDSMNDNKTDYDTLQTRAQQTMAKAH